MDFRKTIYLLFLLLGMTHSVYSQFLNNQVVAHRGAWKSQGMPQNSLASLHEAIELGCAGTEFDVHITKDNVLVVNHDADFYGLDIATSTFEQLTEIKHPNGEAIASVADYLQEGLKQKQTKLIFELKTSALGLDRTLEAARLAVELVDSLQAADWVEYILFDYTAAKQIIALDSNAKVWYLNGDVTPAQAKQDGFYGLDYHFKIYQKNPEWVQQAKDLDLKLNAWTVNSREEMLRLLEKKFDFITTDEPELLWDVLRSITAN